ncbi:alpha/beta fold hydrolase [Kitasatospora kifunensis]|uniref:Pimeloyl-ACP methyl ester carboxylesterase n=1 Tax=Kitasatospora kifunensis TaxID=58351 RepID=A0A7W7VZ80_KITKI|nr:alpha/beta hydrolase [Kitasatospora kifunensis]MBB4927464.1 pimeloyl-ACP methyl ester carboxylesterase [Kitasatospora kifunensis]
MNTLEIGTLAVPGARIHFEVRGTGTLLLLIAGGGFDARVFEQLAAVLATEYRVLSFDPRGNSRSPLDGPPEDQRIEVHADDAYRLLAQVAGPGEAAHVFGGCSGGLTALELAIRHRDRVRSVVVHEPPSMGLLPDAEQQLAFFDEVHETFHREGLAAGLRRLQPAFGGRPAPALPQAQDNSAFFLGHVMRPSTHFVPDLTALATLADRIVVAGGHDSRDHLIHRPAAALAERLGSDLVDFPGGHAGYAKHPAEFAEQLAEVLAAMPSVGPSVAASVGPSLVPSVGPGQATCAS